MCGLAVAVQSDESFLQSLFSGLADDDEDDGDIKLRRRQDMAQFLKEFCVFSQTLAAQNRESFFKVLYSVFFMYNSAYVDHLGTDCICFGCSISFTELTRG